MPLKRPQEKMENTFFYCLFTIAYLLLPSLLPISYTIAYSSAYLYDTAYFFTLAADLNFIESLVQKKKKTRLSHKISFLFFSLRNNFEITYNYAFILRRSLLNLYGYSVYLCTEEPHNSAFQGTSWFYG